MELTCQRLVDPGQSHAPLVYTAVPGSESHDKLQPLSVIGRQLVPQHRSGRPTIVPIGPRGGRMGP